MRRWSVAALALLAVPFAVSCARASRGAAPLADELTSVTFAPEAEVDLAAMTRDAHGLYLRDIAAGTGAAAWEGRTVGIAYTVRLADGTQVDGASRESPMTFRVGDPHVLRAFSAGVSGMREGGMRQLVVPPRLAYGNRQVGRVPPNSVLVMMVYLVRAE